MRSDIKKLASPQKAKTSRWFFKTGKGEYGENDVFIGLTVPEMRAIAKVYSKLPLTEVEKLVRSKIHEERFIALEILVMQFETSKQREVQKELYLFYLAHTKNINNWDLVDTSAPYIVGAYLLKRPKTALTRLAKSKNIWERRIAIVATYHFIKNDKFEPTLQIAQLLLTDTHDLIHKATGWMLREVGKRAQALEALNYETPQTPPNLLQ